MKLLKARTLTLSFHPKLRQSSASQPKVICYESVKCKLLCWVTKWILKKQDGPCLYLDIFEDALENIPLSSRTEMASGMRHLGSLDSKRASGQQGPSNLSRSGNASVKPSPYRHSVEQPKRTPARRSKAAVLDRKSSTAKVGLKTGLEECALALNLFLSNRFSDALELLRPWAKESMYHALGYSTIVVLQAVMTFEQQDIQNGIAAMKDALQTCQKYRKKSTVVESFSSFLSKGSLEQLTEEEMHAEICYAECLLQKAALTFVQDENMISFIKGGLKIRTSYQTYKECLSILQVIQKNKLEQQFLSEFEGGVKLGIGAFNLMLSLLPARIIRLLEFIGFSGNRELGLKQLQEGASGRSMRSPLCCLTILAFHTYISLILGTGEVNIVEAERLLAPFLQQFPNGSLMLFYHARIELLKGNVEEAQEIFRKCISVQEEWKQFHHLCYWELMWIFVFQQNWMQAYYYSDLLCKESKWSKATYVFLKAAILSMLPEEDAEATKENVITLFRQVESLKQRIAGKSIPTEKFAVRKSRRYSISLPVPVKLVLPALEMMYVWNGFPIVSKRKDLSENLLVTVEKAEAALQNERKQEEEKPQETGIGKRKAKLVLFHKEPQKHFNDYSTDDECLVKLLKGCCLKNLQRPLQAELCFNHVVQSEKLLKYDHYLVPFTLFELAFLYKSQGEIDKAIKALETARNNYKDYSMESRLHFRIQAALHLWKNPSD
ncbi:tetratricopeptide repeat protein 39B isoform X3 [Tamandua tetradactyla]|uniref:tetratricopeptide repeat protein 39B isoform X3 n=1 Tax=Tamandua tetradactyla TaxID=48850 RepID=UPI004053CB76